MIIAKSLFFYGGIELPAFTGGAQGHFGICVLDGDVVAVLAIPVEFEEVGDPVVAEPFPEVREQVEGQL